MTLNDSPMTFSTPVFQATEGNITTRNTNYHDDVREIILNMLDNICGGNFICPGFVVHLSSS